MKGWITVTVTHTRGSVPRGSGTSMQVSRNSQRGTIGGGALEWEATRIARDMLKNGSDEGMRVMPLGPDLGQCCGGVVTLGFSRTSAAETHTAPPLVIWGAGHVGRAIAEVVAPMRDREITLIDTTAERLPDSMPPGVNPLAALDMPRAVPHMPASADHLIVTYSHDIDLALCDALLRHEIGSIGLIGSATKWARFRKRLTAMGHSPAQIARIMCPIGDPSLGKHPQSIAIGVAAQLLAAAPSQPLSKEHTA